MADLSGALAACRHILLSHTVLEHLSPTPRRDVAVLASTVHRWVVGWVFGCASIHGMVWLSHVKGSNDANRLFVKCTGQGMVLSPRPVFTPVTTALTTCCSCHYYILPSRQVLPSTFTARDAGWIRQGPTSWNLEPIHHIGLCS